MAIQKLDVDHINSEQFGKYGLFSANLKGRPTLVIGIISAVRHQFDDQRRVETTLTLQLFDGDGITNEVHMRLVYGSMVVGETLSEILEYIDNEKLNG